MSELLKLISEHGARCMACRTRPPVATLMAYKREVLCLRCVPEEVAAAHRRKLNRDDA